MENTLENKAKFFAQYWGQLVAKHIDYDSSVPRTIVDGSIMSSGWYLELKPLSQISDDDFEYIRPLVGYDNSDGGIRLVKRWLTPLWMDYDDVTYFALADTKPTLRVSHIIDFLRSEGYAVPWMGLSVEKQVEYGWIKELD